MVRVASIGRPGPGLGSTSQAGQCCLASDLVTCGIPPSACLPAVQVRLVDTPSPIRPVQPTRPLCPLLAMNWPHADRDPWPSSHSAPANFHGPLVLALPPETGQASSALTALQTGQASFFFFARQTGQASFHWSQCARRKGQACFRSHGPLVLALPPETGQASFFFARQTGQASFHRSQCARRKGQACFRSCRDDATKSHDVRWSSVGDRQRRWCELIARFIHEMCGYTRLGGAHGIQWLANLANGPHCPFAFIGTS